MKEMAGEGNQSMLRWDGLIFRHYLRSSGVCVYVGRVLMDLFWAQSKISHIYAVMTE